MESRVDRSAFEVQCPRCAVTFPIGTRKCLHCGGRTGPSANAPSVVSISGAAGSTDQSGAAHGTPHHADYTNEPIEPTSESPFSIGDGGFGQDVANDRELEIEDEPTSFAQSIIRSLGGFIWVLVLIGFSLARSCGE